MVSLSIAAGKDPVLLMFDPEHIKRMVAAEERLRTLYEQKAVSAAFYWGLYKLQGGVRMSKSSSPAAGDYADTYFKPALIALREASSDGEPAAAWNVALIYQNGWGVSASRLAAAEWYARSGGMYLKFQDREKALAALERAEELDAKNPAALKLRAALFPKK